ncbi:MAG: hypothetical protein KGJ06_03575 [Pseudomonadota bacterium]|nr:hypothetical protein [Pseudomonadota bacterium]
MSTSENTSMETGEEFAKRFASAMVRPHTMFRDVESRWMAQYGKVYASLLDAAKRGDTGNIMLYAKQLSMAAAVVAKEMQAESPQGVAEMLYHNARNLAGEPSYGEPGHIRELRIRKTAGMAR